MTRKKTRSHMRMHLSVITVALITISTLSTALVCSLLFSDVYGQALLRDAQISSEQTVRQATIAVDNYLSSMKERLDRICRMAEDSESQEEFTDILQKTAALETDVYSLMVYDTKGNLMLCAGDELTLKQERIRDLSFDAELYAQGGDYIVSSPHVETLFEDKYPWVVTMAVLRESRLFGGSVYIAMDVRFSEIAQYLDKAGVGRHGYCYVMDTQGNIVYHPQQQLLFAGLKTEDTTGIRDLPDGIHSEKNVMYTLQTTSDSRWRVVGINFTDELAVEKRTQRINGILISLLCCAVIAALTLVLFSRIINAPVHRLIRSMQAFEKQADAVSIVPSDERVAELQELSDSFAHMARHIRNLMDKIRREETELRKTELRALQAQINPHFLYNTLDSILWMCEQGKNEEAVKMVSALAKLFRISISKGRELITIREELQHAKSYLVIQSFRYKNQFSYRFCVDESLLEYLCNKITLQPLIENAIYHGIDRMVDEGSITVTIKEAPDNFNDILMLVEDNGVGMTEEQCRKILQKERSDSSGIGVKNVNDRLKIYFGETYGISIHSEPDIGTSVTIRIPKITKEPENEL